MKRTSNFRFLYYGLLLLIAALSFAGAYFLPVNEIGRTLAGLPFVGALFSALFQIVRDHSSFVKDRFLQEREHAFIVGATSHMSAVVFDKHVEFCEEYLKGLQDLLSNLFVTGPDKRAGEKLQPLYETRRKYRLWISAEMGAKLDDFESKVAAMASSLGLWDARKGEDVYKLGDSSPLDKAYALFSEILNLHAEGRGDLEVELKKRKGYVLVIQHLQNIVGVEELTFLRDKVLQKASIAR